MNNNSGENVPEYSDFVSTKLTTQPPAGFTPTGLDAYPLFPFQRACVEWACERGRAALFADTGLGKTFMQLAWADQVSRHTGGRVLILAPLAVGPQTVREASRFGIDGVCFARHPGEVAPGARIIVTNYDNLEKWSAFEESGVVLDESSILKAYMGATRLALTERFRTTPYRLCCTATPAPNDHLELGTHSEFLGILSSHQMIARWFINDTSTMGTYRLKGHAVDPFWDWVASWSRMVGVPSDIGAFSDDGYVLPPLQVHNHVVAVDIVSDRGDSLFRQSDMSATAVNAERRKTADARAALVADILHSAPSEPTVIWTDTDYDADAVRRAFPGLVEVHGTDSPDVKASRLLGFADGEFPILLTKPKIAAYGLNWQHCANVVFMGLSYSYEAFYQSIRRCWRFGQTRPVNVHVVIAATELAVLATILRKQDDHGTMKAQMFAASRRAQSRTHDRGDYHPTHTARLPAWLRTSDTP